MKIHITFLIVAFVTGCAAPTKLNSEGENVQIVMAKPAENCELIKQSALFQSDSTTSVYNWARNYSATLGATHIVREALDIEQTNSYLSAFTESTTIHNNVLLTGSIYKCQL